MGLRSAEALGLGRTVLVHASSSGGTQAGLVAGAQLRGNGPVIAGINVYRKDTAAMAEDIHALACKTAALLHASTPPAGSIDLDGNYLGEGYGLPTPEMKEAVELVARTEGVLLDPVYTGKGMAGFIGQILSGKYAEMEAAIFLHTGGIPGLFAYETEFAPG